MQTGARCYAEGGGASETGGEDGGGHRRRMSVGAQAGLVGRPGRIGALGRFLDHVAGHDRVWVARRVDIARHWRETYPREGA